MHQKSIGHLGLTPCDIMFSRPGGSEIKICDFSLSKRIVGIVKMDHGQPEFVAPEIVNGEGATFASDMWATGIITYLLLSGVSPFRGQVSLNNYANCTIHSFLPILSRSFKVLLLILKLIILNISSLSPKTK